MDAVEVLVMSRMEKQDRRDIALHVQNVGLKGTVAGEEYSRKTALGASSPAKPALHIPELRTC